MKKILVTSLIGLTSLFALASCGDNNENTNGSGSTTTRTPTETTQTKQGYQVSVQYEDGTGVANVKLQFCDENGCYLDMVTTDANGIAIQSAASILSKTTNLIVHVNQGLPKGYTYDMNRTIVSKSSTSAVMTLHPLVSTEHIAGTQSEPTSLTSLGYYKTCATKNSVTFMTFTVTEAGTYEVETYDDILSYSDTAISITGTPSNVFEDNGGEGKNAKASFEGEAGKTYTIAIQQKGTSTEEDYTFSILKK